MNQLLDEILNSIKTTVLDNSVGVAFYAYFWYRFGEASGRDFEDFGVIPVSILGSF